MGLYDVPLSMSLLGFGIGTILASFHMCGIMLVIRAVFNMLGSNVSQLLLPQHVVRGDFFCVFGNVTIYFLIVFLYFEM